MRIIITEGVCAGQVIRFNECPVPVQVFTYLRVDEIIRKSKEMVMLRCADEQHGPGCKSEFCVIGKRLMKNIRSGDFVEIEMWGDLARRIKRLNYIPYNFRGRGCNHGKITQLYRTSS